MIAVAGVAAIISYQHAYELVSTHGERGLTARLLPFTVDGLIWAASMSGCALPRSLAQVMSPSGRQVTGWMRTTAGLRICAGW